MATGNWGQPEVASSDAMQGAAQLTAAARWARDVGIRRFSTQAALLLATGMLDGYRATVDSIKGAFFIYNLSGTAWEMYGIPTFSTFASIATAITTPATDMVVRVKGERFLRRYDGSGWRPWGSADYEIIPAGVTGTGVTLSTNGLVLFTTATAISINDFATDEFDDYDINWWISAASASVTLSARLRVSGADDATSNYDLEVLQGVGGSVASAAGPAGSSWGLNAGVAGTIHDGLITLRRPKIAAATFGRMDSGTTTNPTSSPGVTARSISHRSASSFTGLSILVAGGNVTGGLTIVGKGKR